MGDDFDFRTMLGTPPPKRRGVSNVVRLHRNRRRGFGRVARLAFSGLLIGLLAGVVGLHWTGNLPDSGRGSGEERTMDLGVGCVSPKVIDGDTLRCGSTRIRLASIDAPEMPGHCRPGRQCTPGDPYASTANLRSLVRGEAVACRQIDTDHYGRAVAFCSVGGRDLSCAQYQGGYAVERYGMLSC